MLVARLIDKEEQEFIQRGQAFFHVSGAGHEGTAALVPHLTEHDWLHCHYRDKALLLLRGVPIQSFFDGLLCKAESSSSGRQMSAHLSDPSRKVLSMVGPVGNNALQAVGVAAAVRDRPGDAIVLCSVGDGTTQEGEFLEACAEAVRHRLPVLFLIEDNQWAISTATGGKTFYSLPQGDAGEFYGLPIVRMDGADVLAAFHAFGHLAAQMRRDRQPALVLFSVKRLSDHTNADDQRVYRSPDEIARAWAGADPIPRLRQQLLAAGVPEAWFQEMQEEAATAVQRAAEQALWGREPEPEPTAKLPLPAELTAPEREYRGDGTPTLTMREAIRDVLRWQLQSDPGVFLYGEDIEDPKSDVLGVTKGLSSQFPGRVVNSPLSEATIVGTSIGRALAGERPVAFIQFADFLPLAYNQILSELGSMYWRTAGGWQTPMIVMVPCGGYRPGLGPFHAQSLEALAVHTPGIDVFMPSTAADAAGLLNAAFASRRPTLFFYPKAAINSRSGATPADVDEQFVPIGVARIVRPGSDLTLVGWGNTVRTCLKVAATLQEEGVEAEVIDLRSLSPWDERSVLASAEKTGRLLVVHEDNVSCGMGAEILATVAEKARKPVRCQRVARPDTYIPCNFTNQLEILPSYRSTLTAAAALLDWDVSWEEASPEEANGLLRLNAVGSGPADESVLVSRLLVGAGSVVQTGDIVAELETSKATTELAAPVAGTVETVEAREGDIVPVGQAILTLRTESRGPRAPLTEERAGIPRFHKRQAVPASAPQREDMRPVRCRQVGVGAIAGVTGSRVVSNADILNSRDYPDCEEADVVRRTGIEYRCWAGADEDVLSLAVRACRGVLAEADLDIEDIDLIVCGTCTPARITPSLACQVLAALSDPSGPANVPAYDINAACSGYLYALGSAYDFLQSRPEGRVLVVTSEVLSGRLNKADFNTAFLFGDAASATVVVGEKHIANARALLRRPELSAKGDRDVALSVPLNSLPNDQLSMTGTKVFIEAVRSMTTMLNKVCEKAGITVDQLSLVIPHQANQRILNAVSRRVGVETYSNIRHLGNTSSSTIPLALREVLSSRRGEPRREYLGLCAFGGGFTFGAAVLEVI
jgi:2-oxoisovalerate dehydrogenase E1 component